ncbi:MAG: alpha/beta hydrolase [Ruminococcaceae bacterium]|nr:alpha/beta hydrolase [Oscillospiraceae bacterium]
MPEVKAEKKKKSKGKKALIIILSIILVIALAAVIFINVVTKPTSDTDENRYAVGGMVISDTVEYKIDSAKGIRHNPIIRIMQMVWRFCSDGDAAKHAVQTPPETLHKEKDIPYIDDGNIYHMLDVYYPEGTKEGDKLPVIIDIHGGGWMYGDKDLNEYYCLALAEKGYVVFNMSYRLVPDVTVNEQLQDVAIALKWISENMKNYPCDGENIMLTGDSAGGQLAVYSAALLQSEELREIFEVENGNLEVTALVLTSPVSYMKDGGAFSVYTKILWGSDYKEKATYNYMDLSEIIGFVQLPPTYLITSSGDSLAHDQTVKAYNLIASTGTKCELSDYGDEFGEELPHVFSVLFPFDDAGKDVIEKETDFFQRAMLLKVDSESEYIGE